MLAWFLAPLGWFPLNTPIEFIPAEARSQRMTGAGQGRGTAPTPGSRPPPQSPSSASNRLPSETPARGQASTFDSPAGAVSWRRVLEAQLALVRQGISPGSLDGILGSQTRAAIRVFQRNVGQPVTGELDAATLSRLQFSEPLFVPQAIDPAELARLLPLGKTWLQKSQQPRLDYESVLEWMAEKSQSHPDLVRRLNGGVDWGRVTPGTVLTLANAQFPPAEPKAAFVRIALAQRFLEVMGYDRALLAHFPCSIARLVEKRPVGELRVEVVVSNPNYTFDPAVFPESAEGRELGRKLVLQPGPNNPVGSVWIGLSQPRYGIHGTPSPELVGRTESHGCFRLANWNAEHLRSLVWVGMPVQVEP